MLIIFLKQTMRGRSEVIVMYGFPKVFTVINI